jgi:hypothetical protein
VSLGPVGVENVPDDDESVPTVVATANVLWSLPRAQAREAVRLVLEHEPDLVALQEWYPVRAGVLGGFGDYRWFVPLWGGCAVGARRDRYPTLSAHTRRLSPLGRADREGRLLGLELPRFATVATVQDRDEPLATTLIDFHLVSQVQRGSDYRDDRPGLVARHQQECRALFGLVEEARRSARRTYACGDANIHGFAIPGLTSAWADRAANGTDNLGGTHAKRRIDDVHTTERVTDLRLVETPSDHRAVIVTTERAG